MATAITESAAAGGKTSRTTGLGTPRLKCAETTGLGGAGLGYDVGTVGIPAVHTDISGGTATLDARLESLEDALVTSGQEFMMAGISGVTSMTAEDSGVVSMTAEGSRCGGHVE